MWKTLGGRLGKACLPLLTVGEEPVEQRVDEPGGVVIRAQILRQQDEEALLAPVSIHDRNMLNRAF
jgi:hypothetical protein